MRLLPLVLALAFAGCGDDTSSASVVDMTVGPRDLSGPVTCSASDVAQPCADAFPSTGCFICDVSGGNGRCAKPCLLVQPSCPTGQSCVELTAVGDGGAPAVVTAGSNCGPYGYCR